MIDKPLVSVIIPVFNRANLIGRSIKSVLDQTYSNLELIVVDDNSSDDTSEVIHGIKDSRLKYIRNEVNLGPSKSRNKGIEFASGELVAFQDSDDEWLPEKLEKQVELLKKCSDKTGAVYCGMEFYDYKTGLKIGDDIRYFDFRNNFLHGKNLYTPANVTVVIKKSVLDDVGYFDEQLFAAEDTELAIRVSKKYDYAFVNEALVKVTRNHSQLTESVSNYSSAKEMIFRKHRDYLSKRMLFGLCKEVANYYILKNDFNKAKEFINYSLQYKFDLSTLVQFVSINIVPWLLKFAYKKKYKGLFPHPSKEGQLIKFN